MSRQVKQSTNLSKEIISCLTRHTDLSAIIFHPKCRQFAAWRNSIFMVNKPVTVLWYDGIWGLGRGEGGALDNCCQWIIPFVIVIILRSEAAHREILSSIWGFKFNISESLVFNFYYCEWNHSRVKSGVNRKGRRLIITAGDGDTPPTPVSQQEEQFRLFNWGTNCVSLQTLIVIALPPPRPGGISKLYPCFLESLNFISRRSHFKF